MTRRGRSALERKKGKRENKALWKKSDEQIEQQQPQAEEAEVRAALNAAARKRIQEAMGNGSEPREAAVEEGNLVLDPQQEVVTVALHKDGAK